MKRRNTGRWWLGLITFLLIGFVSAQLLHREPAAEWLSVALEYEGIQLEIDCFDKTSDRLYFFLPGSARSMTWRVKGNRKIWLDGERIENGEPCIFESGRSYELTEGRGLRKQSYTLTFMQSANLASAFVTTDTGKMDYILKEKGNPEGGSVVFISEDGTPDYSGSFAEIKGRGNYTWLLDKKSFSLNFEEPVSLLSVAEDENWVLQASASEDTHLINRMVSEMMRAAGIEDVPCSTWIDLYLNGEYAGNYLLSQKVKPTLQDQQEGWMIEVDGYWKEEGGVGFVTEGGENIAIGYPEKENLTAQKQEEIAHFVQQVENAVLSENGVDEESQKGWQELADADSLVKKFILDVISRCPDGWNGSNYCFLRDGKLYFGAPWDYEFSFGNQPAWFSDMGRPQGLSHTYDTLWYKELYKKTEFLDSVKEEYEAFFAPYLRRVAAKELDSQAERITASMEMDQIRWDRTERSFLWEVENLKHFILDRLEWLDEEWLGIPARQSVPWHEVHLMDGESQYAVYYIRDGSFADPKMLERDDEYFTGWYEDEACSIPTTIESEPVTQERYLYAGWDRREIRLGLLQNTLPLLAFGVVLLLFLTAGLWEFRRKK